MMQSLAENRPRVKRLPTIPTLDEWLSHSVVVPMASTTEDYPFDDTTSSLGDSTYDFLDDRSTATTDDEGSANLTLSFSSSDGPESETPIIHQSQTSALASGPEDDGEDTTEDNQGSHVLQGGDWGIKFQEPLSVSNDATRCFEVSHVLRDLEGREIGEVLPNTSGDALPTQLSLTVKQTMASHTLVPDGSFRLLFVGDVVAKDPIMQKLGSALAASSESSTHGHEKTTSRFNIVPISSFGGARSQSPEVLLVDSVGLEMSVQDCISASFSRKEDGNDSICLLLPEGMRVTSTWSSSESRFVVSRGPGDWELPNVAIFYLSDTDTMATKLTQRFARSFMSRHKIPSLVITQTQLPTNRAEAITLDYMTPHLCLESNISDRGRRSILKRLPIDLSTFLELNARQLNKNLACLVETRWAGKASQRHSIPLKYGGETAAMPAVEKESKEISSSSATWATLKRDLYLKPAEQHSLILGALFLLILLPGLLTSNFLKNTNVTSSFSGLGTDERVVRASVTNLKGPAPPMGESTKPRVPSALATTFSTPAPVQTRTSKGQPAVDSNTDLASFLLDSHALTPNNSAKFKVHVVGDCHVVLRPPHWFMRYRKAPKLLFNITRQEGTVEHELLMLFDGVYALKVPREEAYGMVNVSVRTTSKPKINETFQVDFGNSWLKAAGWKKAAYAMTATLRGDLDLVQNGLSTVYAHTSLGLQVFVHDAARTADTVRKEAERIRSASVNHTLRTTDLILAQTKDLSRSLSSSLSNSTSAISKHVALYNHHIRKDLALYIEHKKAAIEHSARSLSRSTPKVDLQRLAHTADSLRASHLKETQKNALKAWWKIAGLPKQEPAQVVHEGAAGKSRLAPKKKKKNMR